jgi:hypothetical protein
MLLAVDSIDNRLIRGGIEAAPRGAFTDSFRLGGLNVMHSRGSCALP